ncbi:MAG TPA: YihY/virulence factor BrkB family protein [Pseudomonadales bacterium]
MAVTSADHAATDRGRRAERPQEIPGRGWWDIAMRVKDELGRDNVSLIAAGLGLYALLAIFPALTAMLSLYGLFASPEQAASQVQSMAQVLPQQAAGILREQLQSLTSQQSGALGLGAVLAIVLALWSASKGMTALMAATNIAYDEREERSFIKQTLVAFAFTIAAVIGFIVVIAIGIGAPVAIEAIGLGSSVEMLLAALRWVLLWLFGVLALAVVYRFAPDRHQPRWRWVTWGSAIAVTLWIVASVLFSLYVRNFASYNETYGALGGVVILLMWFYLSGYVVVLGAEINAEMEHQTAEDTTVGEPREMGRRRAHVADTLGETRGD